MIGLFAAFVLLPNAHAHNDYAQTRPLLDALDQGFLSVEADVFLVDGELLVGHDRKELKAGRTLESLYLDPLRERVRTHRGRVYDAKGEFTLMIDLKEDGARLQPELATHLVPYAKMLTRRFSDAVEVGAVRIILSGARTKGCAEDDGPFFKDGTVADFDDPPARTPWISGNYADVLGTNASPLPPEAARKLAAHVARTHARGKKVRLWGGPDGPATWGELRSAKVDLINTDRLAELRAFLLKRGGRRS